MKLKGVREIFKGLVFSFPLARDVHFDALCHEPLILLPNAGGELLLHLSVFTSELLRFTQYITRSLRVSWIGTVALERIKMSGVVLESVLAFPISSAQPACRRKRIYLQ